MEIRPQPLRSASSGEVREEGEPIRKAKHIGSTYRPHFDEKASCTHEEQLLVAPTCENTQCPKGRCGKPKQGEEGGAGVVGQRRWVPGPP